MNIIFIILSATLTYLCVWTAAKAATWNCHKLMRDFSLSSKNVKIHTLTSWKLASASRCLSTLTFIFKKKNNRNKLDDPIQRKHDFFQFNLISKCFYNNWYSLSFYYIFDRSKYNLCKGIQTGREKWNRRETTK